jgi:hypothetical protein
MGITTIVNNFENNFYIDMTREKIEGAADKNKRDKIA